MGVSRGSFPFLIKTSLSRFGSNGAHLFLISIHSSHKLSQLHGFIGSEIYPAPVSNLRSFLEYPTASSAFPFELLELLPKYCLEVCFHHSSELTFSKYIQIITRLCLKLSDDSPPGLLEFFSQFNCSVVSDSETSWTTARQASLSITNFWSLLKLMSIESVMPSNHPILCHALLLLPSICPSIRVFSSHQVFELQL